MGSHFLIREKQKGVLLLWNVIFAYCQLISYYIYYLYIIVNYISSHISHAHKFTQRGIHELIQILAAWYVYAFALTHIMHVWDHTQTHAHTHTQHTHAHTHTQHTHAHARTHLHARTQIYRLTRVRAHTTQPHDRACTHVYVIRELHLWLFFLFCKIPYLQENDTNNPIFKTVSQWVACKCQREQHKRISQTLIIVKKKYIVSNQTTSEAEYRNCMITILDISKNNKPKEN